MPIQKPPPTFDHGLLERWVMELIAKQYADLVPASEVNVQIRPTEYGIPDVVVARAGRIERPYPTKPFICVSSQIVR